MTFSYKTKLCALILSALSVKVYAQTSESYAVKLERGGTRLGMAVTLKWAPDSVNTLSYNVYRKKAGELNWGNSLGTLPRNETQFTDNTTAANTAYEYYVQRNLTNGKLGHGYILINTYEEPQHWVAQKRLLLLIDANYQTPLKTEIEQLIQDLAAEGYHTDTLVISRTEAVTAVKQKIKTWFEKHKNDVVKPSTLYLLGHIPVPYSGNISPDGHTPDHHGAWPADVYYGVMNENIWTDHMVENNGANLDRNKNVTGDGKFDVDYIFPDTSSLEIGRVDLVNMPAFAESDTALVRNYLQKAHAFKTTQFVPNRKAVVDDGFGAMNGEAFAASGWRNFSTIIGSDSIEVGDFLPSVKTNSYLLSYGCGAGSPTNANGIGTTQDFISDSIHTVFTMLFGSYFGDWEYSNNFLRAPLCSKPMSLASMWSGRPHWTLHHMALGQSIGYSTRITQNNMDGQLLQPASLSGYFTSHFPTYIHISLMGDPTLRLFYHSSPQNISATPNSDSTNYTLKWDAVPGAVGYEIYTSTNAMSGGFKAVTSETNEVVLTKFHPGINHVYVKGKFIETSSSGQFHQLSLGTRHTIVGGKNAVGLQNIAPQLSFVTYPNPSNQYVTIGGDFTEAQMNIYDVSGKLIFTQHIQNNETIKHQLPKGLYIIQLQSKTQSGYSKLLVN
jgi:hypothetical protein